MDCFCFRGCGRGDCIVAVVVFVFVVAGITVVGVVMVAVAGVVVMWLVVVVVVIFVVVGAVVNALRASCGLGQCGCLCFRSHGPGRGEM